MTHRERQQLEDANIHLLGQLDRAERWIIAEALVAAEGSVMCAAALLGVYRAYLLRRIKGSKTLQTVHRRAWSIAEQ